ncbi:MAG: CPBP family intramembrane metalloprotease [Salinivirgaceae bacterium]|jgi:membrane protease YdiL (CAAX protease family)|nr:CPBP family intramembrane metalloprotease [Salinivirgaceae bacterium]
MTKKAIIRISIFYIIGIALSNVFRFDLLNLNNYELSVYGLFLISLLGAIGLLIGALISLHLLKKERKLSYSLFGSSRKWSSVMLIIPVILLGVFGVDNRYDLNPHSYGIIGAVSTLIYCFFEEIGWRGYLQDELQPVKEWQRVLLIGFLWYLWHLSFISNQNFIDNIQFLGWMIFGSWGIGKVIDLTKSIIAATCFHMIINVMMFNSLMKNGIDGDSKLIIIGVTVVAWIFIMIIWIKEKKTIAPHYSQSKTT